MTRAYHATTTMGSQHTMTTVCAIIFVTQKGGAGKTTLTVNLAVAAVRRKKRVLILDLDAQASAENWYQDREAETPQLVKATSWDLPERWPGRRPPASTTS